MAIVVTSQRKLRFAGVDCDLHRCEACAMTFVHAHSERQSSFVVVWICLADAEPYETEASAFPSLFRASPPRPCHQRHHETNSDNCNR